MLVPAILYKEQITKEFQKYLYTTNMMYVTGCLENWIPNILECPDEGKFQYAIIDKDEKLLGYLGYSIDYYASRAYNFGLFSFDRGNLTVAKDTFDKLDELVKKLHRVEWRVISGNPACRGYDNFIKKYNGSKHILKDSIKDKGGRYHDDIIYEVVNYLSKDNHDKSVELNIKAKMPERWVDQFCSMLTAMEHNGVVGHSERVGIYSDGDGDFRPKFEFDKPFKHESGHYESEDGHRVLMFDAG